MWQDPMDALIADLETVAPPEPSRFGGHSADYIEFQKWFGRSLRRFWDAYPDKVDMDDPEAQREARNMRRAVNRYVGRPEDWTPPEGPCTCRYCAPGTRADPDDTDERPRRPPRSQPRPQRRPDGPPVGRVSASGADVDQPGVSVCSVRAGG